jgi:hypothetical protein
MKKKYVYLGIALTVLLITGGIYVAGVKKPMNLPAKIEWRPVSSLPTSWVASRDYTWYWIKNNTISCMGKPLLGADIPTFLASSLDGYGKDKNHVYWCDQVVAQADPTSFTILNKEYAKDASRVFYLGGFVVPKADPATFSIVPSPESPDNLQTSYGKDKSHVYNLNHELYNADPATFVILYPLIPKDKNWIYQGAEIVGPASLITQNAEYAKVLPAPCNPLGAELIQPQVYPPAFSADGSIIGYANNSAICVIDKKKNTVERYPYGMDMGVSLSKDGSKILYFKYQSEGAGMNGETCAACGQYAVDRATGKVSKVSS